jgi:hypothetical protein
LINIVDKTNGEDVEDYQYNSVKNQELDLIESTGQTPDTDTGIPDTNVQQLSIAAAIHAAGGYFYVDSGIANAYVLGVQTISVIPMRAPDKYFNGMKCRFVATSTNTGISTVNVAGLGIKTIKKNLWTDNLTAGDIVAGQIYELVYSFAVGTFELIGNFALKFPVSPIQGGTGITTYATGDIIYANAVNSLAKRTIGTEGQIFTVGAGGTGEWIEKIKFIDINIVNNQAIPSSWTDVNLSSAIGAFTALAVCRITALGGSTDIAFRTKGDTNAVGFTGSSTFGAGATAGTIASGRIIYICIKTNSTAIIQVKKQASGTNYSLDVISYIK